MQKSIPIGRKLLAFLLALATILSLVSNIPVSAETLSDGRSSYVTIKLNETHYVLETQGGTKLQGQSWTYTSDTGITGPAYCINWGLAIPSTSTKMPISGRYTATPQTLGAFANGYPQRPLEDFIALNKDAHPILENLTRIEYVAATQAAVWATLGQLAIDGTQYTSGRDTLKVPTTDPSQLRAYEALMIILYNASFWDRPLLTGMHIRLGWNEAGNTLNIEDENGLAGAEQKGMYGIAKETIGGVEYFTRSFIASSATSTFKNGYTIDLRLENAPAGTILADENGMPLSSYEANGVTYWSVPTPTDIPTNMNQNGSEYAGEFKVCIPVNGAPDSGNIMFHASAVITQYDIYFANNSVAREQSFVIADPMYADMECSGAMTWAKVASPHGRLVVNKTDGMSAPLADAAFTLTGADGSTYEGTSDAAGQIVWENLDPSITYTLSETQVPAGYIKAEDVTVTLTAGATTTVSVQNFTENTLRIRKIDAQNGNPLIGATFRIEQIDGSFATEITTNHTGVIELTSAELPYGSYRISEKTAPEGYEPSGEVQTVDWDGAANVSLTFENVREMSFVIVKADAETGIPLGGVPFEVYKDGRLVTTVTTDTAGYATVSGLTEGYYEVKEVAAPEGYVLDSERHGIHLDPYDPATEADPILLITNSRKPSIRILKVDAESGEGLENARFRIQGVDLSYIKEFVTDRNGEIALENLAPGVYEVREVEAPAGYIKSGEVRTFEAKAGANVQLVFENHRKPSLTIIKLDSKTMKPLANAVFEVYRDTALIGTYTTDADGEIRLHNLRTGTYYVKEIAADSGYIVDDTPQQIEISADSGDTATLVFLNDQKPYIRLVKLDSESFKPLSGAIFEITKTDGSFNGEFTTDTNGEINLEQLAPGSYVVREVAAPDGYVADDSERIIDITGNGYAAFVFTNTVKPTLKVTKIDATTGEPLSGAVIRFTNLSGTDVFEMTTDEKGEILLTGLNEGIYTVQEITAPAGYLLDDTLHHVTVVAGEKNSLVLENDRKPSLTIKKYDSLTGEMMAGTTFEIYRDTTLVGVYTTDENGEIRLYDLATGTYTVQEIATDDNHIVNSTPQSIEITANSLDTALLVFLNDQKPYIRLVKLDSQTMQPLVNAAFTFKKVGSTFEKEYTTDENGEIKLDRLESGTYTVTETKAPDGYLIDDAERTVKFDGNEYATFVFTDTKKPSLIILKYDKHNDKYLSGATFRIAKIEDGSHYLDRITDINGSIEIDNLDPGVYSVKEIKAPVGYVLNEAEYHVELFPGKESQLVVLNEEKPNLRIIKTDAITGEPIEGVGFLVRLADGSTENTVVTDANGEALLTHLEPGVYEVIEKSVPNSYLLDSEPKLVTLVPNCTSVVRFENHPKPSLTVNKVDSITKDPLKNARFSVIYASNATFTGEINNLGTYTTDENGQFKLYNLSDGWYKITEIAAPDGYALAESSQEIYIRGGENKVVTFENVPLSGLVIRKVDANTGALLQGARFEVRYLSGTSSSGGTVIGEYTTSANGTIVINRLKAGTYVIEEIKAPDGYIISDAPETVYISGTEQDVVSITFENKKDGGLVIRKLDSVTGEPLTGAEFTVTTSDGKFVGTDGGAVTSNGIYTTDATGQIHITGIEAGTTVIVTETKAPAGYVLDELSQTVKIDSNDTQTLTFYNHPASGILITKLDRITEKPLAGAVFEVTDSSGAIVGTANGRFTTDVNGIIKVPNLKPGTYIVTEITAPDGYTVDSQPQTIKVESGKVHNLLFYNDPASGIVITKLDSVTKSPLAGATFEVKRGDGMPIGKYTTDENGIIHVTGLESGTYVVTEISAPDGYTADGEAQIVSVVSGKLQNLTFFNAPDSTLVITKLDRITKEPLYGAIFEVTEASGAADGVTGGRYSTDANGIIRISGIKPGAYVITEVAAPDGYTISGESQTVEIASGKIYNLTFYNDPAGGLIITKLDRITKEPLYGAVFEVTDSSGAVVGAANGRYVTDANGVIRIRGLKPDTYVVTEVEAPDGYIAAPEPQTIKVVPGEIHNLTFYNSPSGALVITKLDKNTGEPLYGATFKITDSAGTVVGNRNGTYTTNLHGSIYIPELAADTYVVTEILAPDGYTLDCTPQMLKIKPGETHELVFVNEPLGGIRITKLDEETRQPIKGVQYEVSRMNGERIGTLTTNASGVIVIDELENGWYTAMEVRAADGYILDVQPHDIEVADGQITRVTLTNRKSSSFFIHKVDAATGKGIYGVTFLVSDRFGNPIVQYVTDQNGYVYMDDRQLEDGKYFIREIGVPSGYVIDPEVKTFYVEYGRTASITWYNQPIQAQIQLIKKSADDNPINGLPAGSLLEGAVFEIYDKAGNVVDTVTTDKNGRASSKPLPLGLYTIRETAAPMYYTANDTVMSAHLEFNGQIMTFEVLNKSVKLGVSVSKYGYNEVMPDNPLVYSFKNIANTSSVPLESFYFRDTLPSAIRAEQLVTGTFNQPLSYKIVYLTNLSNGEYRTINDNLSTSRNYVIDISNVALGLAENEYLTEIMYVFGTVKAGFAQVELPQLYARSVKGLANGASFVNMADVGGIYNGQWITTISRWVTRVYSYTQIEMPGTGY